jgi:DeoR family fructose operon transcriptional repressor
MQEKSAKPPKSGPLMKRRQRQRQILELLESERELGVEQVCDLLQTSPATVRREFSSLAQSGRVEKTWGGIRLPGGSLVTSPAFSARLDAELAEKRAIARAAVELVKEGDVVMVDGGTTTLQLAEFLAPMRIRLITNSLMVALAVDQKKGRQRGAEVHLTGGTLQPESGVVAGPQAEAFLKRYNASWAFLGAAGVDEFSVTNYNEAVLESERLMIEQSRGIVLLADHTKMGRQAMCAVCPLTEVDQLVTGAHPAASAFLQKLRGHGVNVREVRISDGGA